MPSTYVDYDRGTTFSPQAPFENSAMDKSLRTQQLSDGGATDEREQVDTDAPHETKYIGAIPVDETVDGMARPLGDVKHLDCYGRDEDPECQTSVMPLFDKAKGAAQLSTKQADADIDAYFAQQQKAAMKARKPIRPKMQGTEKLVDTRGTKFGLSDAAARQQVDTIFGAVSKGRHGANNGALADQDKVIQKKYYSEEKLLKPGSMKSGKTQQLRWANNHGSASKIPAHLDAFPTQAATADALQFFDTLGAGPHGANNGALYDAHKHPKNQFKVAGSATQQLMSSKYPHHGYSTQTANADLSNFYHSMPAANNHHLKDKHADRYSDPHTAFLKGHEATLPKKHGARKAKGTQMLRSNRDDAFVGDASPVTPPGTLVKFAGATAANDLNNFYTGLKHSRYGANNGNLRDMTPKGQYKTVTAAKAEQEINGYFSSVAAHKSGAKEATAARAKRILDADHAAQDIDGYFSSLAKGKHGSNNGHLKDTNPHASAAKVSA